MKIIIFGSGGLAKELIGYMEGSCEIVCLVSTEPLNNPRYAYQVLEKAPDIDAHYILAVADPQIKRKIVAENEDMLISYIHPTCTVSPYVKVGKGCILAPQSILTGDCELGDFVFLNTNATVGHDTKIGSYTTMFPNTEVCGDCDIGEDCVFGIGSYVLPKVRLPSGSKASAGSVVRKSIEHAATLYGDPAQPRLKVA